MKEHTQAFKEQIAKIGRQHDVLITYKVDGQEHTLNFVLNGGDGERRLYNSVINSVTPYFKGNLLKSVMKGLNIDCNIKIPVGTEITLKYGVFVANPTLNYTLNDGRIEYEYINYGKYIVYKVEKQEDTRSYLMTCYDKLLFSMVDYEQLDITYPITIRSYIEAICEHIGLDFKNKQDTFANYDKEIQNELYLDLGYTFRDVLDELSAVTGSCICMSNDDKVEVRYVNETNDEIDAEYLKDVNVNFGAKYGPINSIVLSRTEGSDNVYIQDEESVNENGLCEIKIEDNQILNFNDRSEYLPDLLNVLDGIEYSIADYTSTGIMYYELLDKYTVSIENNKYPCLMLNDEQNITKGLVEQIYAEQPEVSETDYKKADKTDRKLNQTILTVDKQNQEISAIITNQTEDEERLTSLELDVDGIHTEVSKKVGDNEIISKINQTAEQIQIEANKISLARQKYKFNRR